MPNNMEKSYVIYLLYLPRGSRRGKCSNRLLHIVSAFVNQIADDKVASPVEAIMAVNAH